MNESFKDKLKAHRPDWDKSALWAALEPELPKPKRSRLAWWIWMLPAAMLTYGSAVLYCHADEEETIDSQIAIGHFPVAQPAESMASLSLPSLPLPRASALSSPLRSANSKASEKAFSKTTDPQQNPMPRSATTAQGYAPSKALSPITAPWPSLIRRFAEALPPIPKLVLPASLGYAQPPSLPGCAATEVKQPQSRRAETYQLIYIGVAHPVRKLAHANLEQQAALEAQKSEEEALREVLTLGYTVGIQYPNGLFGQAGLVLRQRRELLKWEGVLSSTTREAATDQASFFQDQNGQPVYQSGVTELTEITKRQLTQQNYYRALHLPVRIGYHSRQGHLRWLVQIGADVNLMHSFSGKFIDHSNRVRLQSEVNRSLLKQNLGVGWSFAAGLSYPLGPTRRLFFSLEHSGLPTSVHRGQGYRQHYRNWGISLGLRAALHP